MVKVLVFSVAWLSFGSALVVPVSHQRGAAFQLRRIFAPNRLIRIASNPEGRAEEPVAEVMEATTAAVADTITLTARQLAAFGEPEVRQLTEIDEKDAPALTPAPEPVAEKAEELRQFINALTTATVAEVKEATPEPEAVAEKAEESVAEVKEATPEPEPVAEKAEEPVAEENEAAPEPEPVVEKAEEPVAEVKEAAPEPEPVAEKAEEPVAEVNEAAPEPEPVAEKPEEPVAEVKEVASEPESVAEKAKEPVAEVKEAAPEPKPEAAKSYAETTKLDSFVTGLQIFQKSIAANLGFKQAIADTLAGNYDRDAALATLKELTTSAPCVVFTWEKSPFSNKALVALSDEAGANVKNVRLDDPWDEGNLLRAELGRLTGQTSVPSVWIGGVYVGGFDGGPSDDAPGILRLAFRGKLQSMLQEAGALKD